MMSNISESINLRQRRKTPYFSQSEGAECGLACIAMICCYHGHNVDVASLRRYHPISQKGTTLRQLIAIAEKFNINLRPIKIDISSVENLNTPAILHWNLNHFVVLTEVKRGIRGNIYCIHDPARGEIKLKYKDIYECFTGVAIETEKAVVFTPRKSISRVKISTLWSSISGLWNASASVFLLSVISQISILAAPFYLQIAIDTVAPTGDSNLLLMLAIGFGGVAVINSVSIWARSLLLINLNNALSAQIVDNLFRHLLRLPLSWFEKRHIGDIVSRFGSIQPVSQLISQQVVTSAIDLMMISLTFTLMLLYSPLLTFIAALAIIFIIFIRLSFYHILKIKNLNVVASAARESSYFIESIRGISAIKAFGQENNRQRIWRKAKVDAVNASIGMGNLNASFDTFEQVAINLERVLFVYLAMKLNFQGGLTVGMIFAFQSYKNSFLESGARLVDQAMNAKLVAVHLDRISDIALSNTEKQGNAKTTNSPNFSSGINVKNVSFAYGFGEEELFTNVSLKINPGEFIALVGPSGGGKTTLLKIIMGLLEPTKGSIEIGNIPMSEFSKLELRSKVGTVLQDDSLFAGSIADNIAFFDTDIKMDSVIKAAKLAAVHDEISKMPLGYETLVGDMGSALSGGQKQRVLIARALYSEPEVLFIDEGTANLDGQSERQVVESICSLSIIRIVVAHRPALIRASDRVFACVEGGLHPVNKQPQAIG